MGDAYDELDMMLEEPYKAKPGRYERSPPRGAGFKDGRRNARGRSPSVSPPPARRPPPRRGSNSPPPQQQRRGPQPQTSRGRRSPSPVDQWDRSPSPPPRRRPSRSPPPPKKVGRSPPRGSLSPPPRKGLNRSPSRSLSPPPKRVVNRQSPSPSPPPPARGYASRSPLAKRGLSQGKRSPAKRNGQSPSPPPRRRLPSRSPSPKRSPPPPKGRRSMSRTPSPPRPAPRRRSPSISPPPRYVPKGRSPSPPPADVRGGSRGAVKAPPARSFSRSPSPPPPKRAINRSRSPSPPPPKKAPSWNRSPSRSVSPPPKGPKRNQSPGGSPPPPIKQRRSPSLSPPPRQPPQQQSPPPPQQQREWSPAGGEPDGGQQQPQRRSPWKRSVSPSAGPKKSSRSPSPPKRSQSPQPKPDKASSPAPKSEKKEKEKEIGEDGKKRRKSRSKSPKSNKKSKKSRSKSPGGTRKKSPSRKRSSRSRSKERKERTKRSRSKEKWGDRSADRGRYGPRFGPGRWSPPKGGRRTEDDRRWGRPGRSPPKKTREKSKERERKPRSPSPARSPEPTPEERDLRTVLCMQLSPKMRERDLREFMSSVGLVRDVRVIADPRTRKCKGVAYVEFKSPESVALAIGLTGQKLLGIPIQVLPSGAEKNRAAQNNTIQGAETGPMRIYVGSLHYNITEAMLRGIFEPFGAIDSINLLKDPDTGLSRGYGFLTFTKSDDARRAIEQLNGFEIAGRPMKVANVTEKTPGANGNEYNALDDIETKGINMGASGRIHLMAKLAEGTGFQIPAGAAQVLNSALPTPPPPLMGTDPEEAMMAAELARQAMASVETANAQSTAAPAASAANPPINTTCFMLTNMFEPAGETNPDWESEIKDDVIDECTAHGGAVHVHVDKTASQGNVYVKVFNPTTASLAVNALHGRMFAGRVITAAYIPEENYVDLFPDAKSVATPLKPSRG